MKLKIRPSRSLKIAVQTAVFAAWAGLISVTHYPLDSWIARHVPVSLFLRADPLVTTVVWGGMRVGVTILMLGLFTFGITLLLGRVFCGWICPLGSIFDFYSWALNKFKIKQQARSPSFFRFKYYLLAATLVLVAFGVGAPLIALDPIVLLTRTAAAVIEPFFRDSGHAIAPGILEYRHLAYGHLIDLSTLALFIGIMAYTTRVSRVWCRTACPLGAYLAASSSFAVLRRETKDCIQCGICAEKCPTGAIDFKDATQYSESECIKCFVCDDECPVDANFFTLKVPLTSPATAESQTDPKSEQVWLDRRVFLGTIASAAISVPILKIDGGQTGSEKTLLRPPLSREEPDFLTSCIRCGECMKACPSGTLKPAGLEHGLRAFFTPVMTPREAPCVEGCNACSVACPTDAILKYPIEHKYDFKAGTAFFESSKCISYTENKVCSECVRVCPTNAISFELGWEPNPTAPKHKWGVPSEGSEAVAPLAQKPTRPTRVNFDSCVGCGACETACNQIVMGEPAMKTTGFGRAIPTSVKKSS